MAMTAGFLADTLEALPGQWSNAPCVFAPYPGGYAFVKFFVPYYPFVSLAVCAASIALDQIVPFQLLPGAYDLAQQLRALDAGVQNSFVYLLTVQYWQPVVSIRLLSNQHLFDFPYVGLNTIFTAVIPTRPVFKNPGDPNPADPGGLTLDQFLAVLQSLPADQFDWPLAVPLPGGGVSTVGSWRVYQMLNGQPPCVVLYGGTPNTPVYTARRLLAALTPQAAFSGTAPVYLFAPGGYLKVSGVRALPPGVGGPGRLLLTSNLAADPVAVLDP
jgi:hypothetical protein